MVTYWSQATIFGSGWAWLLRASHTERDTLGLPFRTGCVIIDSDLSKALMTTHRSSIAGRQLDAIAANLIVAHDKVLQILRGEIPLPEVVELFLTNYCMFACPFCRCAKYHGDKSHYLDFDILMRFLTELLEKDVKILELGGGGEPLEHPRIGDILKQFIEHHFHVGVITNGYVMTKQCEISDMLLKCSDWVRFSVDAITDDVYRKVHGRDDLSCVALKETIANMARIARKQTEIDKAPKIGIKMIIQQPNEHQVLAAVDEALELQVHYLTFKWLEEHSWSVPHERRSELIERLNKKVSELCQESLIVDLLPGYGGERMQERCIMSVLHPLVDWDGTIYMCAFFHQRKEFHSIGNITSNKFFDCWGSQHHREQISKVDPKQCVPNCPLLRYNPVVKFIGEEAFRFRYI